jgi:hypothetical protein
MFALLGTAVHVPHHGLAQASTGSLTDIVGIVGCVLLLAALWVATKYLPRVKAESLHALPSRRAGARPQPSASYTPRASRRRAPAPR